VSVSVTGHLQVKGAPGARKYFAHWTDAAGVSRTRTLGRAHVKDSGRRTPRGAVIWRAADGPCPSDALTPKAAEEILAAIIDEARHAPPPARVVEEPGERIPTFGDAARDWLRYLELERRRKASTIQDARNTVRRYLLPHFGEDTPLYSAERHEVVVTRDGRQRVEAREQRRDTFTTDDVDAFRRELLASHLSPRSVQKILVLLHALFKLAKRRKLIQSNPSEDAERVTLEDPGTFNILEPVEFEAVYRAVLDLDEDPVSGDREMYAGLLATSFYAGLRLGELLDLPWRNVDFDRSLIRVESGFTHGNRSTPKGKRARSTPMVPVLAQRLAELSTRHDFTGESDYAFANPAGDRVRDANARRVFYAALDAAGLGHKRADVDAHDNPQTPIRIHDLRHSWCTWAVNVWPVTKVQSYAGHRDIQTTMRYVHHQTKAEDADLGGAYLDRVLSPAPVVVS
jgi:integrase